MREPGRRHRILIVDDHALFREGLARLLAAESDIEIAAHCSSVAESLKVLASDSVDLVLLDVDLGTDRGLHFLVTARRHGYAGPVLVVTAGVAEGEAARLISSGAAGIFFKQDSVQLLAKGIRTVMEGKAWIDHRYLSDLVAAQPMADAPGGRAFTRKERNVLRGVLDGLANKEIAGRLELSESSVKAALQQLFQKTGVRTRSQLVRVVLEQYPREL